MEVDVTVEADGRIVDAQLVRADNEMLAKVGLGLAKNLKLSPGTKEGKAVRTVQRVPLFLPVEGDEGPESMARPLPKPRQRIAPNYPFDMRRTGAPGGAIVALQIDAKGRVKKCRLLRASAKSFGDHAVKAAEKWLFTPAMADGRPVESHVNLAFVFIIGANGPEWNWYLAPRPALDAFLIEAAPLPSP